MRGKLQKVPDELWEQKVSRERSQRPFRSKVGNAIPEVILEARWSNIALGANRVTRTLSQGLPLVSWEGHPRSDSGCQMGKYCSGAKSATRTLWQGLPLDSWEGHPRSETGRPDGQVLLETG